jgi:hypothetical protein
MSRLSQSLFLLVGLALILSLAICLKTRRELRAATTANDFLRKTLGGMTVAITTKDREIDRLKLAGCERQEKPQPGVSGRPDQAGKVARAHMPDISGMCARISLARFPSR